MNIIAKLFLLCLIASISSVKAKNSTQDQIFTSSDKQTIESVELFEFDSENQQVQAIELAKSLRCPQCQNQNLIESNSPIAKDLRLIVYQQIKSGKSDQQVIDFMVNRFGEFVLYKPALSPNTWLLWFAPMVVVLSIFAVSVVKIVRNK